MAKPEVFIDGVRYLPASEMGTGVRDAVIQALAETWWVPSSHMNEGETFEEFLRREMAGAGVVCDPEEDVGGTPAIEFVDRVIELLAEQAGGGS